MFTEFSFDWSESGGTLRAECVAAPRNQKVKVPFYETFGRKPGSGFGAGLSTGRFLATGSAGAGTSVFSAAVLAGV